MSLKDCIEVGQDVGAITESQAKDASDIYESLVSRYANELGPEAAAEKAARETVEILKFNSTEKARVKFLQIKKWSEVQNKLNSYDNGKNLGKAAVNLLTRTEGDSNYFGVVNASIAITRQIHEKMYETLSTFKRTFLSGKYSNKTTAIDLVKVAFGEATDNPHAIELYKSFSDAIEYARVRFNRAGGSIPKMESWGLPQIHDALALRKAGYKAWKEKIAPLLDLNKMINPITRVAYTSDEIGDALRASFDTIITDGLSKVDEGQSRHATALYNKGSKSRFLIFKDSKSWTDYQKEFGTTHPFEAMMGYVDSIAKDIAMIETFGPNPNSMMRSLKSYVEKKASVADMDLAKPKNTKDAKRALYAFDKIYSQFNGENNAMPANWYGNLFSGARHLGASIFLGAASLASLTDVATQRLAAQFNGLSSTGLMKNILKQMNPLNTKLRGELAIQAGLLAESWISLASGQARYVGDITGPMITQRLADAVMKVSLLTPWTQAGRWAFGMEFMATFARNSGKKFGDLEKPFQNALKRAGLDSKWDIIRQAEVFNNDGVKIIRAKEIEKIASVTAEEADQIATKYLELIDYETNFAVPTASFAQRASALSQTKANTLMGELVRSGLLFTNFPITMMSTHLTRTAQQKTIKSKIGYGSSLLISTTMMGALVIELKQMAAGKDPKSIKSAEFWTEALLQGGGLGIAGDYVFSKNREYGGSLGSQLAGPIAEMAGDTIDLTAGNALKAVKGDDTEFIKDAGKYISKYTPGKSIFYIRLALERGLFENLQRWTDDKAESKFRRKANALKRRTGQDYWWKPGEDSPDRGPDLSQMFEEPPK